MVLDCAGIYNPGEKRISFANDNILVEEHFAINVLVPFLLYKKLFSSLHGSSKIVFIGSSAMNALDKKPSLKDYDGKIDGRFKAYSLGKYFQFLLMKYIQVNFKNIAVISIHPGMVKSSLSRRDSIGDFLVRQVGHRFLSFLFLSPHVVGNVIDDLIHLTPSRPKESMISLSGIPYECPSWMNEEAGAGAVASDIDDLVLFLNKFN